MHLNFIFHVDGVAAKSLCSIICKYWHTFERRFVWTQFVCWIISIMRCDVLRRPRSCTGTCIQLFLHFQWTLSNIAMHRKMHRITMYHDRIVRSLPILSPNVIDIKPICYWYCDHVRLDIVVRFECYHVVIISLKLHFSEMLSFSDNSVCLHPLRNVTDDLKVCFLFCENISNHLCNIFLM